MATVWIYGGDDTPEVFDSEAAVKAEFLFCESLVEAKTQFPYLEYHRVN